MSNTVTIDLSLEAIANTAPRSRLARLSVFGSAARNELIPESDIDLLVEYVPDAKIGLFQWRDI